MGTGVLLYYTLRVEPPLWTGAAAALAALCGIVWGGAIHARTLCAPILACALGFASAQFATARAPPVETGLPIHAAIVTGTIRMVEALPEGRRITLEAVRLDDAGAPLRRTVRVRLRKTDAGPAATGDTVRLIPTAVSPDSRGLGIGREP